MKFRIIFCIFLIFFILISGSSAEENSNTQIDYNVLEINLTSLFGDFINQINYIFNDIFSLIFFGNDSQDEYGSGYSSGWGINDVDADNPKVLEERFKNGDNVENLTNFSSMNDTEIKNYVTKLASSKGYEISDSYYTKNDFQIWYAMNNPESLGNVIQILIQNKTGKVVIYRLD